MFAGVPCRNVYIVEAGARESVISCTTGPQPQQRTNYPGKYTYMWCSVHLLHTLPYNTIVKSTITVNVGAIIVLCRYIIVLGI